MKNRDQIFPYLTPSLRKRLRLYASKRGSTESSIVEAALLGYLDADVTDRALLIRRLDRVSRGMTSLRRDIDLLSQGFGVFMQLWFAHTPRISDESKAAAEREALRRYSQFLDHVVREIEAGRRFAHEAAVSAEGESTADDIDAGGSGQ
jgi:hypothetical protein